jgi:proteic killer suppression protein
MDVEFEHSHSKKLCENHQKLRRKYGDVRAELIIKRINELEAAASLQDIKQLPQTGFHGLTGNYKSCYAVYLKHPYRLVIVPMDGDGVDLRTMTKICIKEVCIDYH